jgi:hypothetical protein
MRDKITGSIFNCFAAVIIDGEYSAVLLEGAARNSLLICAFDFFSELTLAHT